MSKAEDIAEIPNSLQICVVLNIIENDRSITVDLVTWVTLTFKVSD